MWADWLPGPNPARSTLRPLLRLTPGLSSHKWTRNHILTPGFSLECPGGLPIHCTGTPREPTWNSVGRASVRSFPDAVHMILMGNQMETTWQKILSEPFQWIQIPGGPVPTARSYEFAGQQCCRGRSHQEIPFFSDVSFPKLTFRCPELKASHSPQRSPLCSGGFRAGISERGQSSNQAEKTPVLAVQPLEITLGEVLWAP